MRKFLTGLIRVSCSKIYKFECSKFKQYDKEGFSVSVLKNFMNLCINFIEELCSKAYDSTEFFKLFYHFSKISHELAIYLIQNDTISLMLRYFYFEISRDTPKFPPTNNLKVKSYNKFLLGQPKDIKKKIMTKIDEIKQKKKEKIWLENNNTNRLFMWRTVSYLLCFYRHNKNVERSPFQIGTSDFELSNVEIEFMMGSDENILNILNDANYKISVKAISSMFGYLSYENIKFSEFLLKSTLRGFKERDVNAFRPYFAIIKTLVGIKDSISELRVALI